MRAFGQLSVDLSINVSGKFSGICEVLEENLDANR